MVTLFNVQCWFYMLNPDSCSVVAKVKGHPPVTPTIYMYMYDGKPIRCHYSAGVQVIIANWISNMWLPMEYVQLFNVACQYPQGMSLV